MSLAVWKYNQFLLAPEHNVNMVMFPINSAYVFFSLSFLVSCSTEPNMADLLAMENLLVE